MSKNVVLGVFAGLVVGAAAAVAGTLAVNKIAKEMDGDCNEAIFTSPDRNNTVTVTYGSSDTAKGLTRIKVMATSKAMEDSCKLIVLAKKKEDFLVGEWSDNEHFQLLIGAGRRKQCCDVSFEEQSISAIYYLKKFS